MANSLYDCERVEVEQVMQDTKMDAGGEKKDEKKKGCFQFGTSRNLLEY